MNPILAPDAYTIISDTFASIKSKHYSCYNMVNRYSPLNTLRGLACDHRMVLYGVNKGLKRYVQYQITNEDIDEAQDFLRQAGINNTPLGFPEDKFRYLVKHYNGRLPIEGHYYRDGSTIYPNEPFIQLYNSIPGFGDIVANVEARLLGFVSNCTAAATINRHWWERMREQVTHDKNLLQEKITDEELDTAASWQIHMFGSRAALSDVESRMTGLAHLLSFNGTDNFDAAYEAYSSSGGIPRPYGKSVYALAHRNVQSYTVENDAFKAIIYSSKGNIASCVADCYHYTNAVVELVKIANEHKDCLVVIRPDSGEAFSVIQFIYDTCRRLNNFKMSKNGEYLIPDNVKFIYGDSVNPSKQLDVMSKLRMYKILPTEWGCWGVGGYLVNTPTRDLFSSAFKLCEYGEVGNDTCKLSESLSKMSIPGLCEPFRDNVIQYKYDSYSNLSESFDDTRTFSFQNWNECKQQFGLEYGDGISNVPEYVKKKQAKVYNQWKH